MSREQILDKIKKLLALAQSDNEHEAQSAMLKAQKLLAEHKLSIAEVEDKTAVDQKVVEDELEETFTVSRDAWLLHLVNVIAKNYCCTTLMRRNLGEKTRFVSIIGLEEDAEVCKEIVACANKCVRSNIKELQRKMKKLGYSAKEIRNASNAYGLGFTAGLKDALERQKAEEGWGLVLVTPESVLNHVAKYDSVKYAANVKGDAAAILAWESGKKEGERFTPNRALQRKGA